MYIVVNIIIITVTLAIIKMINHEASKTTNKRLPQTDRVHPAITVDEEQDLH